MGALHKTHWSSDDEARFKVVYPDPTVSWDQMFRIFKRPRSALIGKAHRMGLRRLSVRARRNTSADALMQQLIEARIDKRLTMRDVARFIGDVSHDTIQNAELGRYSPRYDTLKAWADALGLELCLRPKEKTADVAQSTASTLKFDIDPVHRVVMIDGTISDRLTLGEIAYMAALTTHVKTKAQLYSAIYGARIDDGPEPKLIDVRICAIRKKLLPTTLAIETAWGEGYYLARKKAGVATHMKQKSPGRNGFNNKTKVAA